MYLNQKTGEIGVLNQQTGEIGVPLKTNIQVRSMYLNQQAYEIGVLKPTDW